MGTIKTGDIFVATWGYEQTNADFFQVINVGKKSVKVRHIKKKTIESPAGSMSGYASPIKNAFDSDVKTKRLRYSSILNNWMFKAEDSMGDAEKWDGKPVNVSWYG